LNTTTARVVEKKKAEEEAKKEAAAAKEPQVSPLETPVPEEVPSTATPSATRETVVADGRT